MELVNQTKSTIATSRVRPVASGQNGSDGIESNPRVVSRKIGTFPLDLRQFMVSYYMLNSIVGSHRVNLLKVSTSFVFFVSILISSRIELHWDVSIRIVLD